MHRSAFNAGKTFEARGVYFTGHPGYECEHDGEREAQSQFELAARTGEQAAAIEWACVELGIAE